MIRKSDKLKSSGKKSNGIIIYCLLSPKKNNIVFNKLLNFHAQERYVNVFIFTEKFKIRQKMV